MIANEGTDTRIWLVAGTPRSRPPAASESREPDPPTTTITVTDSSSLEAAIGHAPGGTIILYSAPETLEQLLRDLLDTPLASLRLDVDKSALIVDTPGGWTLERFGVALDSEYAAGRARDVVTRDDRLR